MTTINMATHPTGELAGGLPRLDMGQRILIVGSVPDNFPQKMRENKWLEFWDLHDQRTYRHDHLPPSTGVVVCMRAANGGLRKQIEKMIPSDDSIGYVYNVGPGQAKKALAEFLPLFEGMPLPLRSDSFVPEDTEENEPAPTISEVDLDELVLGAVIGSLDRTGSTWVEQSFLHVRDKGFAIRRKDIRRSLERLKSRLPVIEFPSDSDEDNAEETQKSAPTTEEVQLPLHRVLEEMETTRDLLTEALAKARAGLGFTISLLRSEVRPEVEAQVREDLKPETERRIQQASLAARREVQDGAKNQVEAVHRHLKELDDINARLTVENEDLRAQLVDRDQRTAELRAELAEANELRDTLKRLVGK